MDVSILSKDTYNSKLAALLKGKEGEKPKIYSDDKGYPTIGIGYAIINTSGENKDWKGDFPSISPALSGVDFSKISELIEKILKASKSGYSKSVTQGIIDKYYASAGSSAITLSTEQQNSLFTLSLKQYEDQITPADLPYSMERVIVISQLFRVGSAPSLIRAIKDNNRAEAWFQIRYNSNNNGGIAFGRVIDESNKFGLYDSTPNEKNYKDIVRMVRVNAPKITSESARSGLYDDISKHTQLAKDYLISNFGQDIDIDGEVIVGINNVNDELKSGKGIAKIDDTNLKGTEKNDLIFGEKGKDQLIGGAGSDALYGGDDDDILMGNDGYGSPDTEADYLSGGEGFDTYIAGKDDTINDSDGQGLITFKDTDLTGVKTKVKDTENLYKDDEGFIYEEKDGILIITKGSESITIDNWSEIVKTTDKTKEALGIKLSEGGDIEVSTESNSALECLEEMPIPVKLDRVVEEGEEIVVQVGYYYNITKQEPYGAAYWIPVSRHYDSCTGEWSTSGGYMYQPSKTIVIGQEFFSYGEVTFTEGEQEKDFIYRWTDDAIKQGDRTYLMTPKLDETNSTYGDSIKVTIDQSGTGTIIDDDPATRIDPVILDTNKDGFITTTPLANSTTYFDITGDGLRERVGWVSSEDALLVYDKNENGQIDGIDEMFGNLTQSGFDELKQLIDSNHDNKIDRKDELFNQLQVWNDLNGDAKVQEGELRSLDVAGVVNIDLNLVETNIDINGNTLTEASKYTTETGAHELVADVQLATDTKDTTLDPDDIPQFSVDANTLTLPQLKGSGQVYDSFIAVLTCKDFTTQKSLHVRNKI